MMNIKYKGPKQISLFSFFFLSMFFLSFSPCICAQNMGLKTNLLYWASTTPNIGLEISTSQKWTIDVSGGYNPWTFSNDRKIKHWVLQSELRHWLCEKFEGHFIGIHFQGGEYDVSGVRIPAFIFSDNSQDFRYQGYFIGGGLSYGYQWLLGTRWNLEANLGFGYNYMEYDKYYLDENNYHLGRFRKNPGYFGPTKIGFSIIYLIK